jgi:hypothetical protein
MSCVGEPAIDSCPCTVRASDHRLEWSAALATLLDELYIDDEFDELLAGSNFPPGDTRRRSVLPWPFVAVGGLMTSHGLQSA